MGFFGKKDTPPPQDTIEAAPAPDPEKQTSPHNESVTPEAVVGTTADPAVEGRLLRKLDWNLVTLVSFLCMISLTMVKELI